MTTCLMQYLHVQIMDCRNMLYKFKYSDSIQQTLEDACT